MPTANTRLGSTPISRAGSSVAGSVSGDQTTYDFELTNQPDSPDDCKNGGWTKLTDSANVYFKNQGDWETQARIPEEFEKSLEAGKASDWYDDALYGYAEYLESNGRAKQREDGGFGEVTLRRIRVLVGPAQHDVCTADMTGVQPDIARRGVVQRELIVGA